MKRKTMAAVGLACGFVCAVCVGLYLDSVQGQVDEARAEALGRYGGEQLEVVVAKRDISAGEVVDSSALETQLWVVDLLPSEAVVSIDQVQGRVATSSILAGEVVSEKRFAGESKQLDIPHGMIAISVPAKEVQAVGGAIQPGMRVDMYATGGSSTDLVAENVQVLATSVDAAVDSTEGSVAWITVALQPDLVQGIVAAAQEMELYFTLPGEGIHGNGTEDDSSAHGGSVEETDVEKPATDELEDTDTSQSAQDALHETETLHDDEERVDDGVAAAEQKDIATLLNQNSREE